MNKGMLGFVFFILIVGNIGFAEEFILPTHDEIMDGLSWYDKLVYNYKPTSFSALSEPDKWTCSQIPDKTGTFNVDSSLKYTVNCGGDSIINLYKYVSSSQYNYLRDDMSPYTYSFGSLYVGQRYVYECYDCISNAPVDVCANVDCSDNSCVGTTLKSNGFCFGGLCQYKSTANSLTCGYVAPDKCAGVTCRDSCDDTTLNYDGVCNNGICQYSTSFKSDICGYTPPDSCAGVSCNSYCVGTTLNDAGTCNNGNCQYDSTINSATCGYVAPDNSCDNVDCNEICDGTTLNYNGECDAGTCKYTKDFNSDVCADEKVTETNWVLIGIAGFLVVIIMFAGLLMVIKKK